MESDAGAQWDAAYRRSDAPWDIGRPQPVFERLADEALIRAPVVDVGCGTGEQALMVAARGIEVLGIDIAPTAIAAAREKADQRGLEVDLRVGDVLDLAALGRTFATAIDCGVFHTFSDELRTRYVASLAAALQGSGMLHLLCFSELTPGDYGPRRVTQAELRAAFADGWTVERIDAARFEVNDDFPMERPHAWLARISRR
ncbi:MAG TPA: class I SAM-dependent methyltransferase [Candidatus Limnocylindrales bacterium]|nr:class I SAM-dependent methyltransferase [Candidatus Limnocylindrales bacterium]